MGEAGLKLSDVLKQGGGVCLLKECFQAENLTKQEKYRAWVERNRSLEYVTRRETDKQENEEKKVGILGKKPPIRGQVLRNGNQGVKSRVASCS